MATSNIFKKLRNRITRNRKSYDVDPPGGGHGGTVLLRRYDRVPSSYGAGYDCEHFNVLCDFPAASHSPSSSWVRGDVTLPRHFKVRNGHHRTQSHVTVVDTDEIDLYNAIGDHHRRSSCSCTCTGPRKPVVVPVPVVTLPPSLSVTPQNCPVPSPIGRRRDAAKDPLPPIVNDDMQKALQKEHERFKREGKFAVTQAEIPRYTGIDDYSTVDNFEVPIRIQTGDVSRDVDRKFSTLGQPSRKPPAAADRRVGTLHPGTKQGKNGQKNTFEAVSATNSEGKQYLLQKPQITKDIDKVDEPELDTSTMGGECATVALKDTICSENSSGMVQPQRDPVLMDVIDGYHNGNEQVEVKVEPTLKKDKERTSFVHPRSPQEPPGEQNINQSDPGKDTMERFGRMSVTCEESHFGGKCGPQNSGYHEYKEAHQVLRATSASKLVDLNDLELSSSIEDLYAYVPKGSVKTPDSEFDESPCPSEQNTDNEDNFPPPPIPSRNYRKESYTMTVCRDGETGEDITEDGKRGDGDIREGGESEPIHMTLEEVWIEACARGIPMEKPQNGTLQRRQATLASPTSSPLPVHSLNKSPREHHKHSDDNGTKKKEKFKLRNIFKKTDLDCHLRSPGTTRSGRTGDGWHDSSSEDINNGSDSFNTSGEASSSEVLESVGHQSVSSSGESVVEEQTSSSEQTGTINADFIDSLRRLKDCGWYWGPLSWDGAEARLADRPDGSFLVRDSSDDRYILSISFRSQGTTHHSRIEHYKGTFSFYSQPKSHGAGTITEFIEKAMEHSCSGKFLYFLRPRAAGLPPAPVQLLYPVSRFRIMQSLQHMCRFEILRTTRYDHIDNLPLPQKVKGYLKESQYYTEYILEDRAPDVMAL